MNPNRARAIANKVMQHDQRTRAQHLVEAALERLKEEASNGQPNAGSIEVMAAEPRALQEMRAPGDSLVLIVLGDSPAIANEPQMRLKPTTPAYTHAEAQANHPGLERFPILEGASHPAPKPCFIEPARVCVNSGACEMRGY